MCKCWNVHGKQNVLDYNDLDFITGMENKKNLAAAN